MAPGNLGVDACYRNRPGRPGWGVLVLPHGQATQLGTILRGTDVPTATESTPIEDCEQTRVKN